MDYMSIPIINKNFVDFNPISAGYMSCPPGHKPLENKQHMFLMHYITSGKGVFSLAGNEPVILCAGKIFIIPPYTKYFYQADEEEPWSYIWVSFSGKLASKFLTMDTIYDFNQPELFFNIKNSYNIEEYRTEYIYAQLLLIYRLLAPPENQNNLYVNMIRHQICTSYMTDITVESLAKYCRINKNYATRLFKKETGMSINQFIIWYRMQRAMEFLQSGYTVEETSHMVGYVEYHSFTKKFKEFFGIPPSKYKKSLQSTDINTTDIKLIPGVNPFVDSTTLPDKVIVD